MNEVGVTGPDRIPAIVLKMCSPDLSPVLAKLNNKCLAASCFPPHWKSSSVVPVFKNDGERSDLDKYRPISLLPIIVRSLNFLLMIVWLNILTSLAFNMVFVLSGPLLTSWLFSVSVFTIRWMQVERRGLLRLIFRRHSIRFGMPDCYTS